MSQNAQHGTEGAGESIQDAVRAAWEGLLHGGPFEARADLGRPALEDPEQRLNYIAHLNGLVEIHFAAASEIAEKIRRLDETLREDERPYRFSHESALQHKYSQHAGALTALTSLVLDLTPPQYGKTQEPRRTEPISPYLVEALRDVGSLTGSTPLLVDAAIAAGWPATKRDISGALASQQSTKTKNQVLEDHPWVEAALAAPRTRPAQRLAQETTQAVSSAKFALDSSSGPKVGPGSSETRTAGADGTQQVPASERTKPRRGPRHPRSESSQAR